jgi:hypothetical protein
MALAHRETLERFLLDLALTADPARFFPFPPSFRSAPEESKKDPSGLSGAFAPYTKEEFDALKEVLLKLPSDGSPPKTSGAISTLYNYLVSPALDIAFHKGSLHPRVTEYQFRSAPAVEARRDSESSTRWYLFHGSSAGNWHSIVRNGVVVTSGTDLQSHGAVYGKGVYASDLLSTGMSYGNSGKFTCVGVLELQQDPEPFRVTKDYFVIPPGIPVTLRYLLRVTSQNIGPPLDGKPILALYGAQSKARLSKTVPQKRFYTELEALRKLSGVTVIEDSLKTKSLCLLISNVVFSVYLGGFPFSPPLFRVTQPDALGDLGGPLWDSTGVYLPPFASWDFSTRLADTVEKIKKDLLPGSG